MEYVLEHVAVNDIDLEDKMFCHRWTVEPLCDVSHEVIPPVVIKKDAYVIISGFRRIAAIKEQHTQETIQVMMPQGSLTDKELFLLSIKLNAHSALNDIDRGGIVHKAHTMFGFSLEEIVEDFSEICGIDPSRKMAQRFLDLNTLEDCLKDYCVQHSMKIKFGTALLRLSPEERTFMYDTILSQVFLTESQMQQCVEIVTELKAIMKTDITGIFESCLDQIGNSWGHTPKRGVTPLAPKEKGKMLTAVLWQMRNPISAGLRNAVDEIKAAFAVNKNITFSIPDNFEREYCELGIRFCSQGELEKSLDDIKKRVAVFEKIK